MELLYPLTPEVITAVEHLVTSTARSLHRECELSIAQYRALSCLRQKRPIRSRDAARILNMKPSMFSQTLNTLIDRGFSISIPPNAKRMGELYITRAGKVKRHDADLVVMQLCEELFSGIESDLMVTSYEGTLITNRLYGPMRMKGSSFMREYALLESFLVAEHIFKETSHEMGDSLTEIRLLYELLAYGPMPAVHIAQRLTLTKQAIAAAAGSLVARDLIERLPENGDRRVQRMVLTKRGRDHTEATIVEMDRRSVSEIRDWSPGETDAYAQMSAIYVENLRKKQGLSK